MRTACVHLFIVCAAWCPAKTKFVEAVQLPTCLFCQANGSGKLLVGDGGRVCLLVGMVGRAHHGAASGMGETHRQCLAFEFDEALRRDETHHRQVMCAGLQILAQGQHADAVIAQVLHHLQDFLVAFAEPEHEAGFGRHLRVAFAEDAQQFQ